MASDSDRETHIVVVIGAGVIGLSCALELQKAGFKVTIVARDFPGPFETMDPMDKINYTSPWGGAHNRWVPFHPSLPAHLRRDHHLSVRTWHRMRELYEAYPQTAGITFLPGIEYLEDPAPEYAALAKAKALDAAISRGPEPASEEDDEIAAAREFLASMPSPTKLAGSDGSDGGDLPQFAVLAENELPPGVKLGFKYQTWCVNPMVYLCFLLRKFALAGGKVIRRTLASPDEAFAAFPNQNISAVVNASGTGIVPDASMTISRGQTVLVAEPCRETVTRQNKDGTWSFCVPRAFDGGTVVGGTKEVGDWNPKPEEKTRERLLRRFVETHPSIVAPGRKGLTPLRDIVGRRPLRLDGPRIEAEVGSGRGPVVHAYGMGGRGYELSWGVAEAVRKEVEGVLS
ncbi:hypothetical protein VTJ04DRAFT_3253 [Mycothermus thermophilus]|uniref:uncharacterized protein n=1 Tax=Humicola insolens TaxID=85995 RepID=UPI0037445BB2